MGKTEASSANGPRSTMLRIARHGYPIIWRMSVPHTNQPTAFFWRRLETLLNSGLLNSQLTNNNGPLYAKTPASAINSYTNDMWQRFMAALDQNPSGRPSVAS